MPGATRPGTALIIGFFDGLHRGHQALVQQALAVAAADGLEPGAVTFDLHSLEVLHGHGGRRYLFTTEEKVAALRSCGLTVVEVLAFTPEFARLTGPEFVQQILVDRLAARQVMVGSDFRFGHQRRWGIADLSAMMTAAGGQVTLVDDIEVDGDRISSTLVRGALATGDVQRATSLLGRPYSLTAEVVAGRRLGRTIGFPTANLAVDERKVLPPPGVYAVWATVGDSRHPGMLNIGTRPTVDQTGVETVEVHLIGYSGDLYGQRLSAEFVDRLRDERRFPGIEALRSQLETDREAAREALARLR